MTDIATLKRRFGIIGTSPALDRAISVAERNHRLGLQPVGKP